MGKNMCSCRARDGNLFLWVFLFLYSEEYVYVHKKNEAKSKEYLNGNAKGDPSEQI